MLKNISRLEHTIDSKVFQFTCDMDSTFPQVKDALMKFVQYIVEAEEKMNAQLKAQEEAKKAEQALSESVSESEEKVG